MATASKGGHPTAAGSASPAWPRRGLRQLGLLVWAWLWTLWAAAAPLPVPALTEPVTDISGVLSASTKQQLNAELKQWSQKHGSQIAVLIIPSTGEESLFDYSFRVASTWRLGRPGVDDGVLLLLVTQEHKTRLEVGRGLEGALPDIVAKRLLQDTLQPYLKRGQFDAGVQALTQALRQRIEQEQLPPGRSAHAAPTAPPASGPHPMWLALPVLVWGLLRWTLGRWLAAMATGVVAAILAWSVLNLGLVLACGLGFCVFLLCLLGPYGLSLGNNRGSNGGFGGGGGSFGGGGASGDY